MINIKTQFILVIVMVLLGMNLMVNFNSNGMFAAAGPTEVTRVEMERSIDEFQDRYDIPESKIPEMFRNSDERLWKK